MCLIHMHTGIVRERGGGECECRHVCTYMSTEKTCKSGHHVATSRTSTQVLAFNTILQQKEPGLPGERTDPEPHPRKHKMARSTLERQNVRKCSRKGGGCPRSTEANPKVLPVARLQECEPQNKRGPQWIVAQSTMNTPLHTDI